jgi:hypothetical protein
MMKNMLANWREEGGDLKPYESSLFVACTAQSEESMKDFKDLGFRHYCKHLISKHIVGKPIDV